MRRRLPLWKPYAKLLDSKIADTNSISDGAVLQLPSKACACGAGVTDRRLRLSPASAGPYGGAITAALFLQNFVSNTKDKGWVHIDLNGWCARAGPAAAAPVPGGCLIRCASSSSLLRCVFSLD